MHISVMNPLLLLTSLSGALCANQFKTLDNFEGGEAKLRWQAVNDGVMGGLSKGRPIIQKNSKMIFKGKISLDNNGGFSSIRSFGATYDLGKYLGFELRVKGDGRMYYLTARNPGPRMLAYWSPITPIKDKWVTIRIPFAAFYATLFGRKISGIKFDPQRVSSVGFMLYDKREGDFELEIDWIRAY